VLKVFSSYINSVYGSDPNRVNHFESDLKFRLYQLHCYTNRWRQV